MCKNKNLMDSSTPSSSSFALWTLVLKIAAGFTAAMAMSFFMANDSLSQLFDWIYFPALRGLEIPTASVVEAENYTQFLFGVLGAVMLGWAVMMLCVIRSRAWKEKQEEAYNFVAIPLVVWFISDTSFSYLKGFWPNCIVNLGFAFMFGIPLYMIRPHFVSKNKRRE